MHLTLNGHGALVAWTPWGGALVAWTPWGGALVAWTPWGGRSGGEDARGGALVARTPGGALWWRGRQGGRSGGEDGTSKGALESWTEPARVLESTCEESTLEGAGEERTQGGAGEERALGLGSNASPRMPPTSPGAHEPL